MVGYQTDDASKSIFFWKWLLEITIPIHENKWLALGFQVFTERKIIFPKLDWKVRQVSHEKNLITFH